VAPERPRRRGGSRGCSRGWGTTRGGSRRRSAEEDVVSERAAVEDVVSAARLPPPPLLPTSRRCCLPLPTSHRRCRGACVRGGSVAHQIDHRPPPDPRQRPASSSADDPIGEGFHRVKPSRTPPMPIAMLISSLALPSPHLDPARHGRSRPERTSLENTAQPGCKLQQPDFSFRFRRPRCDGDRLGGLAGARLRPSRVASSYPLRHR
jgi:hypothetical protein